MGEELDEEQAAERVEEVTAYIAKLRNVPNGERDLMLGVIRRAYKLDDRGPAAQLHVDDVVATLGVSGSKLKAHGKALERLHVDDIDEIGYEGDRDYGVTIWDPSSMLTWFDIASFCDKTGDDLGDFVLHLKFGLLNEKP